LPLGFVQHRTAAHAPAKAHTQSPTRVHVGSAIVRRKQKKNKKTKVH
jgi:hypothetical protein